MIRDLIQTRVSEAISRLQSAGALPEGLSVPVEIVDPKDPTHGDFATSWALAAAKPAGKNPRELAEMLKEALSPSLEGGEGVGSRPAAPTRPSTPAPPSKEGSLFAAIDVAGPGFLNLRVTDAAWLEAVAWANSRAADLAKPVPSSIVNRQSSIPGPQRINVEFVSVNPNGPITVGSGRGAAFGSTLCNVLEAAGHSVHREYYINDGTNSEQMRSFTESVRAALLGLPTPEGGYKGDYVISVAAKVRSDLERDIGDWLGRIEYRLANMTRIASEAATASEEAHLTFRQKRLHQVARSLQYLGENEVVGLARDIATEHLQVLADEAASGTQSDDLEAFGVWFNTLYSEQFLHDSGKVAEAIQHLIANGAADENPERRKLKLAKGGVVEDVEIEVQPVDEEDEGIEGNQKESEATESPETSTNDRRHDGSESSRITHHASRASSHTLWLRSTKFADDMDRVLRRKDGRLTYIASDVAYHQDKFNRPLGPNGEKADKLITILGPDHHGYIARLHAVLAATEVGDRTDTTDPSDSGPPTANRQPLTAIESKIYSCERERDLCRAALAKAQSELEVLIFQIVRFVKEGKPAPMRKRDGNIYSLRDLMTEIGKDAAPDKSPEEQMVVGKDVARFFYLMRSHDTHMDFDIDLATKGTDENPVFYVQYAHARISSILERSKSGSDDRRTMTKDSESADGLRLTADESGTANRQPPTANLHPKEALLIKKILDLPEEVARCAQDYGVHRLATYAIELARTFHHFYDACRVLQPENPPLQARRLAICEATRHALRGALNLLGVSAPEKM